MNTQLEISTKLPIHIDSTMLTCFRSCPQKFMLEFVQGFRPAGLSIDLHAGGCFALALEHTYRGIWERDLSLNEALVRAHGIFALAWGDFEIPEHKKTYKTFDRVWAAVESYFALWNPFSDHVQPYFDASGRPSFEYTFAIPLEPTSLSDDGISFPEHPEGGPFLYTGRFDMLGELRGKTVCRDEKTTGRSIGANWSDQWELRSQFIGYCWACQQAGIPDVDTIIVRGIAIQKEDIKLVEAEKTYPEFLIDRWHEQLRRDLWRIRRCWDQGYFDFNMGDSCTQYGNCTFLTACTVPESQRPAWLSHFDRRFWNPLHKNPVSEEGKTNASTSRRDPLDTFDPLLAAARSHSRV